MTAQPFFYALVTVYALTGLGCAVAASASGRAAARADLVLLVLLWPLYGPFLMAAAPAGGLTRTRERDLARALRRVSGTPLARLLPDRAAVRALGRSVRAAALRVREIDELLSRPGMAAATTSAQLHALEASGSSEAKATLALRLQSIGQLEAMRDRFARRLAEVDALLGQLLTQVEVLRLGGAADAPGEELVGELVTRVQALGEMLDDGRSLARGA